MRDSVDQHVALWSKELDWLDPVKEAIFARLAILARHTAQARRDALGARGLSHWQFKVLLMLRRLGPPYSASPSQLADMLGLTRGALSARLGPLEEAGLITRANDAADHRRVHVRLTPAGYQAFEQHASSEEQGEGALLSVLTPEEKQTLADLLRKLVAGVESGPDASRAVAEPVVAEPVVAEPVVAEPVVAEPVVAEPVVAEPAVAEPAVAEPAVAEPAVAAPVPSSATQVSP